MDYLRRERVSILQKVRNCKIKLLNADETILDRIVKQSLKYFDHFEKNGAVTGPKQYFSATSQKIEDRVPTHRGCTGLGEVATRSRKGMSSTNSLILILIIIIIIYLCKFSFNWVDYTF